ncbi:hypothetical protein FB45DRAFT_913589 [Roridomyces roridus]|uniref:J domain-containing protein n=1 Tax=Roridomyces roridus TaxID=1738132 RepID=A0AAD7BX98_9AGAR|nr:hypothetical protein FB45DRAFT_913589 [Roridomyces roridus]
MPYKPADAYLVLGLEDGAPLETVKSTYKQLALRTHPDKNPDNPDATAEFQKLSEAYNVLLKHLDPKTSRPPRGFPGFGDDSDDDEYDDYEYEDEDEYEDRMAFYMFLFEKLMNGGGRGYGRGPHPQFFRREPVQAETPEEYTARLRRSREEQIAAEERRKQAAAARRAEIEMNREIERAAAEERQKAKTEAKKAQAQVQRSKAEAAALALQKQAQAKRTAVFTAARAGQSDKVKKGVWEDGVDAAGGEVQAGCNAFVKTPKDPQQTLLHIAAQNGDKDLIEWLDAHSADPEERDSSNLTAFHVALECGHIPAVQYFFEAYPSKDSDSKGVYQPPESKTLLSIALSSQEPELVYQILDKGLATEQDINSSWTWVTSAKGRAAMKKTKVAGQKSKMHEEKVEDIMKLLMRFGGFTPPPTPSSSDNSDGEDQWDRREAPNQAHPSEEPSTPGPEQQKKPAQTGGRGRGRGRGGKRR